MSAPDDCGNDCFGPNGHAEGCPEHCGCYTRELSPEELATVARFEQAPDALGPCMCAHYGNASRCPHHTQEDYDLAEAAREAPDALGLREEVAEAAYTAIEWSGCAGSAWSRVPVSHRRKWYDLADALLPLIERREAEAAERGLTDVVNRLDTWEFPPGSDALEPMYRLVTTLRAQADHIGGTQ